MTNHLSPPPTSTAHRETGVPLGGWRDGLRGAAFAAGNLLLVALIAALDYGTGPELSFSVFYLIPVVAAAWWGGFPHGILLSLAGAFAWHLVDGLENPLLSPTVELWNSIARFGTLLLTSSLVARLHSSVLREQTLARTDPLTGAANGRTFYERMAHEAERARRTGNPMTLAYLDLDNFKQLNDRLGHAAGDAALVGAVQAMRHDLRQADVLARLGGDEFALLLPDTDAAGGVAMLHRIQGLVDQEMALKGWAVTVSVGAVTFLRPQRDVDVMIQRVDAVMYEAKRQGKDRVVHAVERNELPTAAKSGVERRATARILCNRSARVRVEEVGAESDTFAVVSSISHEGIGLLLETNMPKGTVLVVELLTPGARTLLAKVLHATPKEVGWMHGCRLTTRLSDQELDDLLGEPAVVEVG